MKERRHLQWHTAQFQKKWASKPKQTVNSLEYKELKRYIHMPYRKIDHLGVKCYYFPTYTVFKIKNITEFDFDSLSAKINGLLIIKIRVDYVDQFSPSVKQRDQDNVNQALQHLFKIKFNQIKKQDSHDAYLHSINPTQKLKKQHVHKQIKLNRELPKENQNKTVYADPNQEFGINHKKYVFIQFNRDDPIKLPSKKIFEGQIKQEQIKNNQEVYVMWTIRKEFKISLNPGNFWSDFIAPFSLLNFKLTLSFEDLDLKLKNKESVRFKFNCMRRVGKDSAQERKHIFQQISFTDDGTLGEYDIAEKALDVNCHKYLSKQHHFDISSEYRSYKDITFTIPFYKYPIMDSLTIFIPLVLITILTLFTFVQGPDFNDKIGNIATLMIVYVGMMPVISESLPPTTNVTLIDIVVYSQLTISVLCLIRGFIIKDYDPKKFQTYHVWQDPIFIASVAIAGATALVLAFLLIYYNINKNLLYNLQEADIGQIEHRLSHWVSPHMHNIARNIKTVIQKNKKAKEANQRDPNHMENHLEKSITKKYQG